MYSLYSVLGLEENATQATVEVAYTHLRQQLALDQFKQGTLGYTQCMQCLLSIENAYRTLINPKSRKSYEDAFKTHLKEASHGEIQPKLGQLCVAAGIITLEQLDRAVDQQIALNLPIGQILQQQRAISQAELDGLLLGQQLIRLPPDSPHSIGQRLIAMELVTEDMVRVALIEQRTFDLSLDLLLIKHGWLDKQISEILLTPLPETALASADSKRKKPRT